MNKIIYNAIKRVYIDKDYEYYKKKCKEKLSLNKFFENLELVEKTIEINVENDQSIQWHFILRKYNNVDYKTILYVSKIVPIFYIQHEFSVENNDPNKIEPALDGFGGQPYNKQQAILEDHIKKTMNNLKYTEIGYYEFNNYILSDKNGTLEILDGENYTADSLLFNDMLDIIN